MNSEYEILLNSGVGISPMPELIIVSFHQTLGCLSAWRRFTKTAEILAERDDNEIWLVERDKSSILLNSFNIQKCFDY